LPSESYCSSYILGQKGFWDRLLLIAADGRYKSLSPPFRKACLAVGRGVGGIRDL